MPALDGLEGLAERGEGRGVAEQVHRDVDQIVLVEFVGGVAVVVAVRTAVVGVGGSRKI